MNTLLPKALIVASLLSSSLFAFGGFRVDINDQIQYDEQRIKEYKAAIKKLEKELEYLKAEKAKNPELYIKKPLYEDLKEKYVYRIKLNGAKTDGLNFIIKDNTISVSMNIKSEQKDDASYFYSSRYFSQSYRIPEDVKQEKISHKINGDYFEVELPKKP